MELEEGLNFLKFLVDKKSVYQKWIGKIRLKLQI